MYQEALEMRGSFDIIKEDNEKMLKEALSEKDSIKNATTKVNEITEEIESNIEEIESLKTFSSEIGGFIKKIYGITIDDGWYDEVKTEDIIEGIKKLPVKPIVRIVMSKDIKAKDYVSLFKEIHKVAYIMAQPVDSFEMNTYSWRF